MDDVENIQNIYDRDLPKNYFKMTEDGLECLDCDPSIFSDSFKKENEHFKLNIDKNGVEIKVKDGDDAAEIKIGKNGMKIK